MRKKFTILTAALALLAMLAVPTGGWGQTLSTSDLVWPVPVITENFNELSVVTNTGPTGNSGQTITNLTAYGVFNKIYLGKTYGHVYSIVNDNTFGSNVYKLESKGSSYLIASMTGQSSNFGSTGAFSIKIAKSNNGYFGLYGDDDTSLSNKNYNSVYFRYDGSKLQIYNAGTAQEVGNNYSTDTIEVCVVYNNTETATTYGNSISLGAKKAHVFVNGNCVMNGSSPNDYSIQGSSLTVFRFCPANTSGYTMTVDDLIIYNSLPTAPSGPTITADPTEMEFTYASGGSAANQNLTITGSDLTAGITATITEGASYFSISEDEETWATTLSLPADGDLIAVRLNSGITEAGTYNGTLTLSSTGATDVTVSLTGIVTPPTHDLSQYSDNIEHGSISFSPQSPIEEGATVTLTATPDDGYELDSWTFYKEDGVNYVVDESITVENNTFTMPAYDLWVDATFTAKPTYAITCVSTMEEMASLFASPESAYQGQTVTLSYLTEPGCILSSIAITKTSDGSDTGITPTASGDNFTFTMPAYPVTVTATFVELHEASYIFNTDAGLQALGIDKPSSGSGIDLDPNHNYVSGIITMTCTHGSTATRVWNKSGSTELRVYNGGTLTFSIGGSGYCITKVRFEGTVNLKVGTTDVTNKQWIGNAQSITFTNKSSSSALATIIVEYSKYYTLDIAQHGADGEAGWYLIASPVASVTPSTSNGFLTENPDNYDLYRFNQDADLEWENYKAVVENTTTPLHTDFNALINGKGYLYANGEVDGTTLTFTGAPYNGNGEVQLYNVEGAGLAGWNLIGNPFGTPATIGNKPYYRMNYTYDNGVIVGGGNELTAATGNIAPMEGIFVHVSQDSTLTFNHATTSAPAVGMVAINILQEAQRGVSQTIDRAIVRFGENGTLPKFQLNPNHTKVYIPQDGKDYAVVGADNEGEMPVNFRANTDGQYTLSVNPEGVEMNYLHLIDNMTGNDIDLLQTPSYSFNAKTTDYESRFRLVFAANNESGVSASSTTFAFYSNGNWMVNNEGEATLQVIDVMGRVLSNQTISGTAELSLNQQPGVYVLRLVNGNDVKTQKIVVR